MTKLDTENNSNNSQNYNENDRQADVKNDDKYQQLYIEQLHETIKELRERCERAENQYDELVNITVKPKLIEAPKKKFLGIW